MSMHPTRTTKFTPGLQCRYKAAEGYKYYTILGLSKGAGLSYAEQRVVYQSNLTRQIFHRTTYDFVNRMEIMS